MKMEREYVEIAGIKWAKMNVGAEKETEFGLYFQYGAKQGYHYPTNLCKFDKTPKNFCDSIQAYLGNKWRMPTLEDFDSLMIHTIFTWVEDYKDSGVNGNLFTDKTDNSKTLFFPACGYCVNGYVYSVGDVGNYWSSSLDSGSMNGAWFLNFCDGNMFMDNSYSYYGFGVRGVIADK